MSAPMPGRWPGLAERFYLGQIAHGFRHRDLTFMAEGYRNLRRCQDDTQVDRAVGGWPVTPAMQRAVHRAAEREFAVFGENLSYMCKALTAVGAP